MLIACGGEKEILWHLERIVGSSMCGRDVTRKKCVTAGGSSSALSMEFAAEAFIFSALSMITILYLPSSGCIWMEDCTFRICSMEISFLSSSTETIITSGCVLCSIFRHGMQVPHGAGEGAVQKSPFINSIATNFLPIPSGPEKR